MEEIEVRKRWVSRLRRPTAVCFILFVILLMTMTPISLVIKESFYVSRFTSITLGPLDEEMSINFDFYASETDIITGGETIRGHGRRLDPSDNVQEFGFPISLLWNVNSVWVKVFFDQPSGTPPSVVRNLIVGQSVMFTLLDIEISIIIE